VSNDQLKAIVIEKVLFPQDEVTLQAVLKRLTDADPEVVSLAADHELMGKPTD
jgi:hypothetical protein